MRSGSKIRAFCPPPPNEVGSTRLRSLNSSAETRVDAVSAGERSGVGIVQSGTSAGASLTRRRAIRIVAAVAGLPLAIAAVRAAAPPRQLFGWQGAVLGALAGLGPWHTHAAPA